jgi:cytochrome c oxidase subunit 1
VLFFCWIATMWRGAMSFETPMLFALGFIVLFGMAGLTGLVLADVAADAQYHHSYFVVAHFHYVMMGGTMFAFIGGLHYWWPKITGRMYNETLGNIACLTAFIGFNMTFMSQFVLGTQGMPRRYYSYLDQFQPLHAFSSVGSYVLGLGFLMTAVCLITSLKSGAKAPDDPWGGTTLEWKTSSPPPLENFEEPPVVTAGPYDRAPAQH